MSIKEQLPESRTSITIVAVLVLCAIGVAYSQGWFNWSSPAAEAEMNQVSTSQVLDPEEAKTDAVPVTNTASELAAAPADAATE